MFVLLFSGFRNNTYFFRFKNSFCKSHKQIYQKRSAYFQFWLTVLLKFYYYKLYIDTYFFSLYTCCVKLKIPFWYSLNNEWTLIYRILFCFSKTKKETIFRIFMCILIHFIHKKTICNHASLGTLWHAPNVLFIFILSAGCVVNLHDRYIFSQVSYNAFQIYIIVKNYKSK